MTNAIRRLFLEHPESINETYGEHARFAFGFAFKLLFAGFAALIHAIIPGVCEKTASKIVQSLADKTAKRGR